MLDPPSYLYRCFFPFAENTGCTPSVDCEGALREIRFQEILHSILINLGHFIHILMTPSTSLLSELPYSSWIILRSVFKHGENIIHHTVYQTHIHQRHHKFPLANFLASTYIFKCNVLLVYVI